MINSFHQSDLRKLRRFFGETGFEKKLTHGQAIIPKSECHLKYSVCLRASTSYNESAEKPTQSIDVINCVAEENKIWPLESIFSTSLMKSC